MWDYIINVNEIFNPSNLLELKIENNKEVRDLSLFKNLRCLKLKKYDGSDNSYKIFLPQMTTLEKITHLYHDDLCINFYF